MPLLHNRGSTLIGSAPRTDNLIMRKASISTQTTRYVLLQYCDGFSFAFSSHNNNLVHFCNSYCFMTAEQFSNLFLPAEIGALHYLQQFISYDCWLY
jgi:hypothetical protein